MNKKTHIDIKSPEEIIADLEKQERKLREIIDMLPETIFEIDIKGKVTFINDTCLALFGYSRDDFAKGIEVGNLFCPYETQRMNANMQKVLKGERNQSTEYMALKRNGTVFPVLVHSRQILCENIPVGIRGVLIDLTENYKIRKQLEREKNFVGSLLDTANSLIVCLDSDEKILVFNKECEKLTGYTFKEVRGKNWREIFIPGENRRPSNISFSQWIKKYPENRYEGPLLTKSGEVKTILWSNTVFSSPDSDEIMAVAIGHDITEKKLVESTLKESEQRYSLLFEYVDIPIFTVNKDGVFKMMNKAAAGYLGGLPEDFIGKTMWDLFPRKIARRQMNDIIKTLEKSRPMVFDNYTYINSEKKWFRTRIYPITDIKNSTSLALLIARDISAEINRKIRMNARFQLLDNLRHADTADDCLEFGCLAIQEAQLFKRAVLTLHNESRKIIHLGQAGLDPEMVNMARRAKAPDRKLARKITQTRFKIGNSYFIPTEAGFDYKSTERYIAGKNRSGKKEDSWKKNDELFVPVFGSEKKIEGWLSVDTPFDGKRPTLETIRFLEEICEMVIQRSREILNRNRLASERKALQEKNIALKEILGHIEEEKTGFKQRIAENIDQFLLPVLNRMIDDPGNISKSNLTVLKNSLKDLGALSGGIVRLYSKLSAREIEVCNMIKIGWTSKEIARTLQISVATVQKHRETVRRKLGLTNKDVNLLTYLKNL